MKNPRGLTVTLTLDSTNYNLLTLLQALDSTGFATGGAYVSCRYLGIQVDVGEGADVVMVGNSDLSATVGGRQLLATQLLEIFGGPADTISLGDIYLRTTVAGTLVHVMMEFA